MKNFRMGYFFITVFAVYYLCNTYLYFKGYQAFDALRECRFTYALIFFSFASIFVIAKILETRYSSVITDTLNIIGGFWLALTSYRQLAVLSGFSFYNFANKGCRCASFYKDTNIIAFF